MSTKEVVRVDQAREHSGGLRWRRIISAAVRLDLAIAGLLVMQWLLLNVNSSVIVLAEVLALSFLMSWRFVAREVECVLCCMVLWSEL